MRIGKKRNRKKKEANEISKRTEERDKENKRREREREKNPRALPLPTTIHGETPWKDVNIPRRQRIRVLPGTEEHNGSDVQSGPFALLSLGFL